MRELVFDNTWFHFRKSLFFKTNIAFLGEIPYTLLPTKPSYLSPYLLHNSMLKELFGKALKCKNKSQEARRKKKLNRKKVEGKSFNSRDGGLKQDAQEQRRQLWAGKIRRRCEIYTVYFFSPIANEDKYTGWQTSPPLCPTLDKKLDNV